MLDAAIPVVTNDERTILSALHRYPNGRSYYDIRYWSAKLDDESDTTRMVPTRKGIAIPAEHIPTIIDSLTLLHNKWKRRYTTKGVNN